MLGCDCWWKDSYFTENDASDCKYTGNMMCANSFLIQCTRRDCVTDFMYIWYKRLSPRDLNWLRICLQLHRLRLITLFNFSSTHIRLRFIAAYSITLLSRVTNLYTILLSILFPFVAKMSWQCIYSSSIIC